MRQWSGREGVLPQDAGVPFHAARTPKPRPHRNMRDALASVGALPSNTIERARGLLHRWFREESALLTTLNTAFSLFLFVLALTMTYIGMKIAQALGLVVTLNEAANAISPYAGVALLALGGLRFVQALFVRSNGPVARFLGFVEAAVLIAGGVWAEAVAWYTGAIPDILKPQLAMAGGIVTANLIFFSTVVIPFFKPAMAAGLGALLTAKQIKTTAVSGAGRTRWYVALIGLIASAFTLVIGMDVGHRHLVGTPEAHDVAPHAQSDLWAKNFAPPFAHGTWCRVSDMFGPRVNPFWGRMVKNPKAAATDGDATAAPLATPAPAAATASTAGVTPAEPAMVLYGGPRMDYHPGVDIAVREGTPVYAMANGRVAFAGYDSGFGNMVALETNLGDGEASVLNGHMQALNVATGQTVSKGTLIGWVGSTGHSTGPHLHVQVCPQGHNVGGAFRCGVPANPYEVWATLAAIARLSCNQGPAGF
jgi:hypothetical protein